MAFSCFIKSVIAKSANREMKDAVFFYVRYGVSYRDLEEIMEERGVKVDHSTLNRWVIQYSSSLVDVNE